MPGKINGKENGDPMCIPIKTVYDPRLVVLVMISGDASLFRNTGVPYFTLRNWVRKGRGNMSTYELMDRRKATLVIKNLKVTAELYAVKAMLELVLTTMKVFNLSVDWKRLPDASAKEKLLATIEKARKFVRLKDCLDVISLTPSRFHSWVRRQKQCRLQDYSTCPKSTPTKLTIGEQNAIKSLIQSREYAHFSVRALALYALIMGFVACSPRLPEQRTT